jgi:hypothetical protein
MDMATTTDHEEPAMTTTNTTTIVYGTAAYTGGKIHRTSDGDHVSCLNGHGHKPLEEIFVKVTVDGFADFNAEVDALIAAKVDSDALCRKCCGGVAYKLKQEVGA